MEGLQASLGCSGSSSHGDFDLLEPVQDHRMIDFYNNNGSKSNLMAESSRPQSYLQSLLINTKYKIDSQIQPRAFIAKNGENRICMLGKEYGPHEGIAKFNRDFSRLLWITYRKGFAPLLIEKNKVANLTTDAGWGCVIRCSQMLLANTLRIILRNEIVPENKALSKYQALSSSSLDCKKSNYLT